ncbi:MAG: hypothetical protein ACKOTH_02610, partial [Solirubrobacterales bacterium]
ERLPASRYLAGTCLAMASSLVAVMLAVSDVLVVSEPESLPQAAIAVGARATAAMASGARRLAIRLGWFLPWKR